MPELLNKVFQLLDPSALIHQHSFTQITSGWAIAHPDAFLFKTGLNKAYLVYSA
jgi:hypothetical protein